MSIINSQPLIGASGSTGYKLQRSVRLRSSASAYFSRTAGTNTSSQKGTIALWVKRGALSSANRMHLFQSSYNAAPYRSNSLAFEPSNVLTWEFSYQISVGGGWNTSIGLTTNAVYRDPSAWMHICIAWDTTQATASNRAKMWVNAQQVTSLSTATYPTLNENLVVDTSGYTDFIGDTNGKGVFTQGTPFDGYIAEFHRIDGQQLDPSYFTQTDPITGVPVAKKYAGTYGTNGFYLNFSDNSAATAAAIGKDSSGNGNNWTPNNISVTAGVTYDSMTDVPTLTSESAANFAVMSPITGTTNLSSGNLYLTGAGAYRGGYGSIALPATGKWYWEGLYIQANNNLGFGLAVINPQAPIAPLAGTGAIGFNNGGQWWIESSTATTGNPGWTATTVVGMRYDASTGEFSYTSNGSTWTTIVTGTSRFTDGRTWVPAAWAFATNDQLTLNFGQRPFSYTPPSGFKSLNTYNLPTPTIANGARQFAATLYTGNGSTQSITNTVNGVSFQPDMVWVKARSVAYNNYLEDSVRGVGKDLSSNSTDAEATYNLLTSFNSNGFTAFTNGTYLASNQNGTTYVAWQWKASNAAAVTNTSGSISSQVSANTTSGFSIVTWTGNGSTGTIGHGLGIAPKFIITKYRNAVNAWLCYSSSLGAGSRIYLNQTDAAGASATVWNNTSPTSSVFSVGDANTNASGGTYVAYCFAEVAGYSKAFSYTGNGSTDGVFSYLGFRPRMILLKRTDTTGNWYIWDTSRNTYNVVGEELYPNLSNAAATATDLDLLSNGFKLRNSTAGFNASGGSYVGFAWAESPFSYSLAR